MIKELLFNTCAALGTHQALLRLTRSKLLIVMYHGVINEPLPLPCWWQLSYDQFFWQIKYLNKNYAVLPLQEVVHKLRTGEKLPDNTAVITFDDGFENNYTLAYPLLKAMNIPAVVYVVTDFIGTKKLLWLDELFMLFLETTQNSIDLKDFGLRLFNIASIKNKQHSLYRICEHLKKIPPDQKDTLLQHIRLHLNKKKETSDYAKHFKLLSWEQIGEMKRNSMIDFGAHSCTHEILSQLNEDQLIHEIKDSCHKINPGAPALFAYPNGRRQDFNTRAKIILKNSNVVCAVSTISGLNSANDDLLELKRISIGNDTTRARFKLLCSGFIDAMKVPLH